MCRRYLDHSITTLIKKYHYDYSCFSPSDQISQYIDYFNLASFDFYLDIFPILNETKKEKYRSFSFYAEYSHDIDAFLVSHQFSFYEHDFLDVNTIKVAYINQPDIFIKVHLVRNIVLVIATQKLMYETFKTTSDK